MYVVLELYIIYLDTLSDQSQNCSDNQQFWLENVRWPTAISSTAYAHIASSFKYLHSTPTFITKVFCLITYVCSYHYLKWSLSNGNGLNDTSLSLLGWFLQCYRPLPHHISLLTAYGVDTHIISDCVDKAILRNQALTRFKSRDLVIED